MIPYVAAGIVTALAGPGAALLARLARRPPTPVRAPRAVGRAGGHRALEAARLFAGILSLVLLLDGGRGDLLVAGLLVAVAVGAEPAAALVAVLVAAGGAVRVVSTDLADVAGAHTVLGPAITSPEPAVAGPAVMAAVATAIVLVVTVPPAVRGGPRRWFSAGAVGAGVGALSLVALALAALAGSPAADSIEPVAALVRAGAGVVALVAAALARRVLPIGALPAVGSIAVALGGAGVIAGLAGR